MTYRSRRAEATNTMNRKNRMHKQDTAPKESVTVENDGPHLEEWKAIFRDLKAEAREQYPDGRLHVENPDEPKTNQDCGEACNDEDESDAESTHG